MHLIHIYQKHVFIHPHMSRLVTKPTKWRVCPVKTQISLGIHPVWSESSLSAWRKLGSSATHWAHSKDSEQTGQMPRLICVFAGRTCHIVGFVMRRLISLIFSILIHYFIQSQKIKPSNLSFSATCKSLTAPSGGSMNLSTDGVVTTAYFTCDVGSTLLGAPVLTCQSDSTWDLHEPSCGNLLHLT